MVTHARSAVWAARGGDDRGTGARILFYHRIADDDDELAVRVEHFRAQMRVLAEGGYRVVDVAELARLLRSGPPPRRTIGLSFDDGYADVAENALPALAEHGFSATVFVATAVIDGTVPLAWYDVQPPLLSWDDVVRLDRGSPLRFEAHTITHPNLIVLDEERAREEIAGSRAILSERLGRDVDTFCYPAGLFGERERRLAFEAGFRAAVTCEPGTNDECTDPLALFRIQVDHRDRLLDFRAKVAGGHDAPLPLRGLYRRLRYGMRASSRR